MKSVFIFGAGASRQAGGPLMSDFFDKAEELYRAQIGVGDMETRQAFEDVFQSLSELGGIHNKAYLDLNNFETVFGAIEMGILTGKFAKRDLTTIRQLKKSMLTMIVKTLEYSIPFPIRKNRIYPPEPYLEFVKTILQVHKSHKLELSFLTFNYDLALDFALYQLESIGGYRYGLPAEDKPGKFRLLKLHGSLNWGICTECHAIVPYKFSDLVGLGPVFDDQEEFFYDLGSNIDRKNHHGLPLQRIPVLVPPTWNKTDYHDQLAEIWQQASRELESAENIFVIGYSLPETDSFFRYLYALGSESESRIKRFWVFDPDPNDTVQSRFRSIVGRGIESRFRFISGPDGRFDRALPVIDRELRQII